MDADYGGWFDWLDAHILLREAEALIKPEATAQESGEPPR